MKTDLLIKAGRVVVVLAAGWLIYQLAVANWGMT